MEGGVDLALEQGFLSEGVAVVKLLDIAISGNTVVT
jgi:hypothetical protein